MGGEIHEKLSPKLNEMAKKFAHFRGQFPLMNKKHLAVSSADAPPLDEITSPRDPHILPIDTPPLPPNRMEESQRGEMRVKPLIVSHISHPTLRGHAMRHLDEMSLNSERIHHPCHHENHMRPGGGKDWDDDEDLHPWERRDNTYSGVLLWGARGDACMYNNFDNLSDQCQNAILNLYELHDEYLEEEESRKGIRPGVFIFFLFIIGMIMVYKRNVRAKKFKKDKAMYDAMQANPGLKAEMESASGVVMDAPKNPECRCLFVLFKVLLCLVISFFIIHIAAFVTMVTVENMLVEDEETGVVYLPNPFVPFVVFFGTLIALVCAVFCLKSLFKKRPRNGSSPSSPNCARKADDRGSENNSVPHTPILSRFDIVGWFNRGSGAMTVNNGDYAALPAESLHGGSQEMVVITPTAPTTRNTQTVVLSTNFPSTANAVTPVTVI